MSKHFGMAVLFVRNFQRCLDFYRDALGMTLMREYSGPSHPDWALLKLGDFTMALHAGHEGTPHSIGALCINFLVKDAPSVAARIAQHGGRMRAELEEADFRPTQNVFAWIGQFEDPDGNAHFVIQEIRDLP